MLRAIAIVGLLTSAAVAGPVNVSTDRGLPAAGASGSTSTTVEVLDHPVVTVSASGAADVDSNSGAISASRPNSGPGGKDHALSDAPQPGAAGAAAGIPTHPAAGPGDTCNAIPQLPPASVADLVAAPGAKVEVVCPMEMRIGRDAFLAITSNRRLVDALAAAGFGVGDLRATGESGTGLVLFVVGAAQ